VHRVSYVQGVLDNWFPLEAENEGLGLRGSWQGLRIRAGKKKDRIEIIVRGGVGGRGPNDLGVGDSKNDTSRAEKSCIVLKQDLKPMVGTAAVGDRVQVSDFPDVSVSLGSKFGVH
jgi:hypothetical protein